MTKIKDVSSQIRGVSYQPNDLHDSLNENSVILLRANNINDDSLNFDDVVYVDKSKVSKIQYISAGDILVCASSGSKNLVGKATFVKEKINATFGAFCKVVRPKNVYPSYLGHYFTSPIYRETISSLSAGANINNIKNEHINSLEIKIPNLEIQKKIAENLDKVSELISMRKKQLDKLDELVKSRFVEMFGEPIDNTNGLPTMQFGKACYLKAGITTSADEIHDQSEEYQIPCYGGNGIRGYVKKATQSGSFPIIGRQGALCGNVQMATGEFHATEHAVLVTLLIESNVVWIYYLLKFMDLHRYHTGAAQPGLAVKTLNTVEIPIADISLQNQFAAFAEHINKSKAVVNQSLEKLEMLKKALMQKYFG